MTNRRKVTIRDAEVLSVERIMGRETSREQKCISQYVVWPYHPRPRGRKMAFRRDAFSDPMMEAS